MFKKLVAHLKFSPSLIGELAELANRLRVQNPVRIFGVVSLGVLVTLQAILYINPPVQSSPTYAGSMFYDSSIEINDLVNQVDSNYRGIGSIFNTLGISSQSISQGVVVDEPTTDLSAKYRLSRWSIDQSSQILSRSDHSSIYVTPVGNWKKIASTESPFIMGNYGESGSYIISTSTGSMYLSSNPLDEPIQQELLLSIDYINMSTQRKTTESPLKPGDRIKLTLKATNPTNEPKDHLFTLSLGDALEYLDIETDGPEVEVSDLSRHINWGSVSIPERSSSSREIILKVKSATPNLPRNQAHPYSQDCVATLVHGNQLDLPVSCSLQKELEMFTGTLPKVSQGTLLIATIAIFLVALTLLAKALQEEEEIRIIRHKFNSGS